MTPAADLHQRGLAAASAGRFEEAVGWLGQAVEAAPGVRQFCSNLGLGLAKLGRWEDAASAYRRALELEPGHAETLAKLGRVLTQAGRHPDAVAALEQAAAAAPANPDTANALGAALAAWGEREDAAGAAFRRAVALDPGFGEAWRNLGLLEARRERWSESVVALERAIELEPASADLFYQLGVACGRTGRHGQARLVYERAVALEPRFAEGWNNLGHELAALGESSLALEALHRALRLKPDYIEARYNLGVTLQSLGRDTEARAAYQLVLAAAGAHADALNNLGGLCLSDAEPVRAAELYERALEANPSHPEARWNLGLAQLSLGRWKSGWENYESRHTPRQFTAPRWRRGDSLEGRSILLWCEQGLGDGIQFLRYAAGIRRLGARHIAVECPARLSALFALAAGVDQVIERGANPPAVVDYQVSLMSLPLEFATAESSMPAPGPAYRLPEERRAAWRRRLDGECSAARLKAGLVWGGNPVNAKGLHRSMALSKLAPLAGIGGVQLISLQHGAQRSELAATPGVLDWPQQDLADTAALAAELDLVITVDTLMAHLAGTLARPTWVMLPLAADWRWMTAREDSPWYPRCMRLFRQSAPGDWTGVVHRVAAALAAYSTATL